METVESCYNKIVEYFSREGAELSRRVNNSRETYGVCYYRHPEDGRACAVGCLLTDEEVTQLGEGKSVRLLAGEGVLPERLMGADVPNFLTEAQRAHDGARDVPDFLSRLGSVYESLA